MAHQVVWSPKAVDDVDAIAIYVACNSPSYAAAIVGKILDATRTLSDFPFAGRIVPEFGDAKIRERFVYSYRVIYRVQDKTVTIAAVIHGKRLLEEI